MKSFKEWKLEKVQEDCGEPHKPRKMEKIKHKEKKSSGTRMVTDNEVGKDYKGHLKKHGDVEPFKVMSKKR